MTERIQPVRLSDERMMQCLDAVRLWDGPLALPQRPANSLSGQQWQHCLEQRQRGQDLDPGTLVGFIATHRWLSLCEQRLGENRSRLATLLWAVEHVDLGSDEATPIALALAAYGVRDVARKLSHTERTRLAESWTWRTPRRGLDMQACEAAA